MVSVASVRVVEFGSYRADDTQLQLYVAIDPVMMKFLDPEGGSQNATLVVPVVVISSLKIPMAFLLRSGCGAQRNFAYTVYTFMLTFPADLPSQMFKLMCN